MFTSSVLQRGRVYTREELRQRFGISDATLNTGVFKPAQHNSVWLFVTERKTSDRTQYVDQLDGNTLFWDGQTAGHTDRLITDHELRGLELLVFYRKSKGEHAGAGFVYEGRFRYSSHSSEHPTHFVLTRLDTPLGTVHTKGTVMPLEFNRWWEGDAHERYWLEVTDRKDLGVDLNAPQRRDDGEEYYGYSLIREVQDGDIVFHYHKPARAIVAWSVVTGHTWEDEVFWGAHGTSAREAGVQPYARLGWRLGLAGTLPLVPPLDLQELRSHQTAVQAVRERLEAQHGRPVYFSFEPPEKRDLRPTQAYLTKLPAEVVGLFAMLSATGNKAREARPTGAPSQTKTATVPAVLGAEYREADEEVAVSERDPFTVDPALVERAHRGHAATQNRLAHYLRRRGLTPRSPAPGDPNFDLAWVNSSVNYVAEIKSLTRENEEKQLRLGLGQVLRYRQLLGNTYDSVSAILMAEREPADSSWIDLCRELKVLLVWPDTIHTIP